MICRRAAVSCPPALNDQRAFMSAPTRLLDVTRVIARVRAVQSKVAIYVDTLAPAAGSIPRSSIGIAKTFDQRLYPIDTAPSGANRTSTRTALLVLMTNVVNKLVSASVS